MRRFVSRALLSQCNTLIKRLPVRLSQHYQSKSDAKFTDIDEIAHPSEDDRSTHQNQITASNLRRPVATPSVPFQADYQLLDVLNTAKTINQLLETVSKNAKFMNEEHLNSALKSIVYLQSTPRTAFSCEALHNHEGFVRLCHRIRQVAPAENPLQIINYLKAMISCGVGSDTKVVQTLLHEVKRNVKNLKIHQILFLDHLLTKLDGPIVEALNIALPIIVESKIKTELDLNDVELMRSCLLFATSTGSAPETIKYIADGLCKVQFWTPNQTCNIIGAIKNASDVVDDGLVPLLKLALGRLASVVDLCDEKKLRPIFAIVGTKYAAGRKYWYNEELCEAVAKRVVREKWRFKNSSSVGQVFAKMAFVNIEFLDYLSTLIVKADNLSIEQAYYLINSFAVANYKPPNFEAMMDALLRFSAKPQKEGVDFLPRFALAIASLDVYPLSIIQRLFSEKYFKKLTGESATRLDLQQLARLYRAVRFLCPDYLGPFPEQTFIDRAKRDLLEFFLSIDSPHPLKTSLELALGGSPYVESAMFTKHGHFIDHVVVIGPDNIPVAINKGLPGFMSVRDVEDIKVPDGCEMLLISIQWRNYFATNKKIIRGMHALELRSLESAGFNVMTLDLEKWESLQENERIPFLTQEIQTRARSL